MSPFEPVSFFQSMIFMLLERRIELRGVRPEWVREVSLLTDNSGCLKDVVLTLNLPVNERPPALSVLFGSVEAKIENSRVVSRQAKLRIRLS
jgi:hypothetical protein